MARKRVVLSKLEILDHLLKGESQASLSLEYGIGKSTVADLKKWRKNLKFYIQYGFAVHAHQETQDHVCS